MVIGAVWIPLAQVGLLSLALVAGSVIIAEAIKFGARVIACSFDDFDYDGDGDGEPALDREQMSDEAEVTHRRLRVVL